MKTRTRGFEIAQGWENKNIVLPKRSTTHSAGYDIAAAEDITIPKFYPGINPTLIPTGLKAYCQPDECYFILNRSSGPKKGIVLANGVGLIDADYYNNPDNDGHFKILVFNVSDHDLKIKKGDRIAQVVFQKFLTVDDDAAVGIRQGGIGSTNSETKIKPLKVIYDVDDVLWPCTETIFRQLSIDYAKQDDFKVDNNAKFTAKEKQAAKDAFTEVKNFSNITFYPAARDIFKAEELGAKIEINSNCYAQNIIDVKYKQLQRLFDSKNIESKLHLNLVTPHEHKTLPTDTYIFIDDNPYNIANSTAKFNLIPRRPWNTTSKMQQLAKSSNKIILSHLDNLMPRIHDPQRYIIYMDNLDEINQLVYRIVNLTKEENYDQK